MLCRASRASSLCTSADGCGGGGGVSIATCVDAEDERFRESEQLAFTVMLPGGAPVVLSVAELPLPEMVPPLAVQLATLTGTLSGLVQEAVSETGAPA